ncbi:MAG: VWA domain-containing protein [Parcubacteria group bacterium]|nr:VWA domain-containing protein [Parcubacteria group bacterium]
MNLAEKDRVLAEKDPAMFRLVQKLDPHLERHGLVGHVARVALVLDISRSMERLYQRGLIQGLVDRLLPLGHRFDDNGAVDVFTFGVNAHDIGEVSTSDHNGFVARHIKVNDLEGGTMYAQAIRAVRRHYFGSDGPRRAPHTDGGPPIYVVFVTDGETYDESETVEQIRATSHEPIFWQFVALGADYVPGQTTTGKGLWGRPKEVPVECPSQFRFLNSLDERVRGRFVDNANFFAIESPSPDDISDEELFARLMGEYPQWLARPEVKLHLLMK